MNNAIKNEGILSKSMLQSIAGYRKANDDGTTRSRPSYTDSLAVKARRLWCLMLCMHFTTLHWSQDPAMTSPKYPTPLRLENIGVEQGLSQGLTYAATVDKQGQLWVATKEGLNRYDGYDFRVFRYDAGDPGALAENLTEFVFADSRGRLWASVSTKGLEMYLPKSESFYHFRPKALDARAVSSTTIRQITEDGQGNVFFRTLNETGYDVLLTDQDKHKDNPDRYQFTRITDLNPGMRSFFKLFANHAYLHLFFQGKRDEYWISTIDSLYCFGPEARAGKQPPLAFNIKKYQLSSSFPSALFIQDPRDQDLFILEREHLLKYDAALKKFVHFIDLPGWIKEIHRPFIDGQQRLWFQMEGTEFIRLDLKDKNFQVITFYTQTGNKVPSLFLAAEDRLHNLWFGSSGYGLFKLSHISEKFKIIKSPDPYNIPIAAWTFKISTPGFRKTYDAVLRKKWAALAKEMLAKTPGFDFQHLPMQVAQDLNGYFYATGFMVKPTQKDGIYRFDPQKRKMELILENPEEQDNWFGNPIFIDQKGALWTSSGIIGDSTWLYKWSGSKKNLQKWKIPVKATFRGYRFVIDMVQDASENIWLATAHGLFVLHSKDGQWKHFESSGQAHSLPTNTIMSLAIDPVHPERFLWMGTNGGGLCRLDMTTSKFTTYNTSHGLPNNVVYGVEFDVKNNIWLSTNRGICLFDTKTLTVRNFGLADGLPGLEFNTYSCSQSFKGEICFGGVEGQVLFDPRQFYDPGLTSPLIINRLEINNKSIQLQKGLQREQAGFTLETPLETRESITLTHLESMVTIGFTLLDLTHPDANRYKYKLEGFNKEWIDAGFEHEATYTNLGPGTYYFKVMGCNSNNVWSKEPTVLKIVVLPPWWSTLWFRALAILALLSGIYFAISYRYQKALQLQSLRMSLARDLHDEIGSNLSSISIYSLAMKKSSAQLSEETKAILDKIRKSTAETMESMNDIVWTIDPKNDSYQNIIDRMRGYALAITENEGIELHFEAEPEAAKLDMRLKKNMYLIFKEAVNNAIKYSACTKLVVRIYFKHKKTLIVEIQDDGKGFDAAALLSGKQTSPGNGLKNMLSRARECGGKMDLESTAGNGTLVRFSVNL